MALTLKEQNTDFQKLERFDGANFKRWQKKMHFVFSDEKLVYVLTTSKPQASENDRIAQTRERLKWEHHDYHYNFILKDKVIKPIDSNYEYGETSKSSEIRRSKRIRK